MPDVSPTFLHTANQTTTSIAKLFNSCAGFFLAGFFLAQMTLVLSLKGSLKGESVPFRDQTQVIRAKMHPGLRRS